MKFKVYHIETWIPNKYTKYLNQLVFPNYPPSPAPPSGQPTLTPTCRRVKAGIMSPLLAGALDTESFLRQIHGIPFLASWWRRPSRPPLLGSCCGRRVVAPRQFNRRLRHQRPERPQRQRGPASFHSGAARASDPPAPRPPSGTWGGWSLCAASAGSGRGAPPAGA